MGIPDQFDVSFGPDRFEIVKTGTFPLETDQGMIRATIENTEKEEYGLYSLTGRCTAPGNPDGDKQCRFHISQYDADVRSGYMRLFGELPQEGDHA